MPRLFVIETPTEIAEVTAMDWQDAVDTWLLQGGLPHTIDCIREYESAGAQDTIH